MKSIIQVKCSKGNLARIRDFVNSWLSDRKIGGILANQIVLAIDEACANCIIHHHRCDGRSKIELCMYLEEQTVRIEIKDSGTAFPLDQYKPRAINDIIRKRNKGGMGIFLIHSIMDEIEIEQKTGHVVYKFAKHLTGNTYDSPAN